MMGLGHKVLIVCQPQAELFIHSQKAQIPVEGICMNRLSFIKAIQECKQTIDNHQIDIVNTHSSRDSWIASLAGKLSSIKPIILRTRHLSIPVRLDPISRFIYKKLPNGIITTGEVIRKELIEKYRMDDNRVVSIPTGVDCKRFNPNMERDQLKTSLGLGKDTLLIGMISVLRSWKGHLDFIDAAEKVVQKIPSTLFIIVGEGPMRSHISERMSRIGLEKHVHFFGYREDIPEILSSLDLLVHPSYANEGVPQTVLQGMAMGKAVVACDVGGIPEVVQNGINGLLVPPRDPRLLSEAIIKLLKDNKTRKLMGEEGRKEVLKRWTIEMMIEKTLKFYGKILERR